MSPKLRARGKFVGTFVAAIAVIALATVAQAARKPNIVVILADDLGYGELGFQGNREIPTPHIDSIAKNGIRFTQGYVSGPYCSPTRAGLLTGRYQTRFGHEFNEGGNRAEFGLPVTETTIADRLKTAGYATCAVGKWHLGYQPRFRPTERGFGEFYGTLGNTPFFHPNLLDSRVSPDPARVADAAFYTTDAFAERAVDWIERNKERPFFLYLPFNAQHAPLQATEKYLARFPNITDEKRRTFAAMMSAMDDAVGRVLAKIRDAGQEENTLVFFFTDNGGPTQQTTSKNDPLRGVKATTLEGGVRVPFAVQWKGRLPAGKTFDKPVIQLDILPTALAAAGERIDPALKLDGVNLLPHLTGEDAAAPHETLYWRFGNQWAVRHGDWKLVASRIDGEKPRLFNLAADIGEARDLAADQPEKAKQLRAIWEKWNAEQMAPRWRPAAAKKKAQEKAKARKKRPEKE
jgi:arylsulfatase A-like enzyme